MSQADTSELDSITDLIFAKIPDHHLKQQFVDKTKTALLKWKDTEIAKARINQNADIAYLAGVIEGLMGKPHPYIVKNYPHLAKGEEK